MACADLDVTLLTKRIGAEMSGVDLRAPTAAQIEAIISALAEHQVLVFRDQSLDPESLSRAGSPPSTTPIMSIDPWSPESTASTRPMSIR